jgi:PAS domain S-box-containing protein
MERPPDRVTPPRCPENLSARLLSALSLMSEATLVLDESGAVLAANELALEMFGYSAAEPEGRPVTQLLPLGHVLNESGPPRRLKLEGKGANGVPFPAEASMRWVDADKQTQVLCAAHELRYGALVRLGGDEYAVLLPAAGRADAEVVAGALVAAVRERAAPQVTVSAGIAVVDAETASADDLLVSADRAMYTVKRRGGDGYAFA